MGIARYLSKLAGVLSSDGVVPATKGGTGITSPGASGNVLVSDGTSWTSQNIPLGATGPTGPGGLGFSIAKTYSSVAALTADTSPTGIQAGQFALIDTGDTQNPENSRLYVWTGSAYTYTSDLSGAQGIVGPTGPAGTDGIIGVNGATGPTGPAGPAAGSANQIVYKDGTNTATGSANLTFDGTDLSVNGKIKSTFSSGNEGGEIQLATAQTNSVLAGGSVAIDINQSQLRIFETGGSNRGVYVNLASAATGVGTNLLAGSGASYDAGDVVVSAKASKYTAPTWLPCDGAMYTPGTYPGLDALYQTAGDYATMPGLFTEPKYTDNSNITWANTVNYTSHSTLDPLTGDLIYYSYPYPAGSRVLYIQRASDGRFVYDPSNQLAADIVSDYGGGSSQGINFAISPNGQLLFVQRYSGGILATMYKRNSSAVEASTGVRWVRQASTTTIDRTVNYASTSLSNDGIIVLNYASTSYFAYVKYDIPSKTFSGVLSGTLNGTSASTPSGFGGQKGFDWHPTLTNYAIVASSGASASTPSGMYVWNGGGFNLVSTSYNGAVTSAQTCSLNNAGNGAYFVRSTFIDIHAVDASNGNLTYQSSITVGTTIFAISFSQGDNFMVLSTNNGILMYQRTAPGALTYTNTGYSPENYGNFGIANTGWKVQFDPVYNVLVGFGSNGTTGTYTVQNWKGIAKTIVPATANPGKNLKYYIKTGS